MESDFQNRWGLVFLDNPRVMSWQRNPHKIDDMSDILSGITIPREFLGLESFHGEVGEYSVHASAAKYLADVRLINPKESGFELTREEKISQARQSVLLSGGIQIYQRGNISGTSFEGRDLVANGRIYNAYSPKSSIINEGGLNFAVFCGEPCERDRERVVGRIIEDYRTQEKEERVSRSKSRYDAFRDGEESGAWRLRHGF